MCTAISYRNGCHYFGRNLDLEHWFCETVTVTPRYYPFHFRSGCSLDKHYAMIGIASVVDGYPLYYDATNEHGLSMAGLNFPGNAVYFPPKAAKQNLTPYELIPWLLGKYTSVKEVRKGLWDLNITDVPFSDALSLSPLHWLISDRNESIVLESTAKGVEIFENPVGVLTNNPPFSFHLQNLANYLNLTALKPTNRFAPGLDLKVYSRGMGGIGLPGDLSSASRFVRAAFTLHNSVAEPAEDQAVSQFFHILGSVAQQSGCVKIGNDFEKTLYSTCYNTDAGILYYKTYNNSAITAVKLTDYACDSSQLKCFPLRKEPAILYEN